MDHSRSVPPVNLIPLSSNRQKTATNVASDLRWLGIDEFLKAKSLAPNTEKAYRRELRRFSTCKLFGDGYAAWLSSDQSCAHLPLRSSTFKIAKA